MNWLKSHWPTIAAALGGVLPFLLPSILAYVSAHPHTTVGVLLAAVVAAYNATAPKDQAKLNGLKVLLLGALVLGLCSSPAHAQTANNIYAAGVSGNPSGSPMIAGTGLYARLVSGSTGTYAFTAYDVLPNSYKPLTVTSNVSAGVAQKIFTIGKTPIFIPSSAGISFQGSNTGWAWTTGATAPIKIGKGNWRLFPTLRVAKSSVSGGTGVQPIFGLLIGYIN